MESIENGLLKKCAETCLNFEYFAPVEGSRIIRYEPNPWSSQFSRNQILFWKQFQRAAEGYQLAAEQGYADAQNHLGISYKSGEGVPQEKPRAAELFQLESDQGHAVAQNNLGLIYQTGQGVSQNHMHAAELFSLAADQGHAAAQNKLGLLYENGQGVPVKSMLQ